MMRPRLSKFDICELVGVDLRNAFSRVKQNKHSCWIVLYPEGTRRSPGKLARVSGLLKTM